jgi:hypothetical protein
MAWRKVRWLETYWINIIKTSAINSLPLPRVEGFSSVASAVGEGSMSVQFAHEFLNEM